ncbi:META domain-containing protein [Methanoplanus sp. FWC-SCC4]|uniref:META domain-containing protein n=1 Tax=Methanochimaera problematica TaxID=2609417 RepID=A0AA97FDM9_9EURY|nr:META domain-containing protein [Methanoplanus sp. FWC-SCC4]WOF17137.1 META domain-containing protein [Methanoplanus sp. FWC-SCC4]
MNKENFNKFLSFIAITAAFFAVVITPGCISGDQNDNINETPEQTPGIVEQDTIFGHTWVLKSLYDNETEEMLSTGNVSATLVLGEDKKISGNAGCNNFFGEYTLENNSFKTGVLGTTLMACFDEETALVESIFLKNLDKASSIKLAGDKLAILDESGKEILVFEKATLAGSEWELLSMKEGDAIVSIPANTTVSLSFKEGKISGNTGCNNYFANYNTDEISEIEFGLPGSTKMYCDEETMKTESSYLGLLEDVKGYRISGNTLTLTDSEGKTLLNFKRTT